MTIHLDCYPCLFAQIVRITRQAGLGEDAQQRVFRAMVPAVMGLDPATGVPGEMMVLFEEHLERETGLSDPLGHIKRRATEECLALAPYVEKRIAQAEDAFEFAVRAAIAGNTIDIAGPARTYDIRAVVDKALSEPLGVNHIPQLKAQVDAAGWVLMLADNAGETVLDTFLIRAIGKRVVYAVKGGAVSNDATLEDARAAGVHEVAELVTTGAEAPGAIAKYCSAEFLALLESAPVVIAKGMANFETLWERMPRAYYLFQAKCPVNAGLIGVPPGSFVVAGGQASQP